MAVVVSLTKAYASTIFESGAKRFSDIREDYKEPVKEYAATGRINGTVNSLDFTGYTDAQIQNALNNGWITQQEYDETMVYKYPPVEEEPPVEDTPVEE